MDNNRLDILNASNKMLGKLQLLSAYFGEEIIYKIYMRSRVIHDLFETNPELDINKLDLFHLQFTSSVIELLKKIKTGNEKNVSLLYNEINLNKDMIAGLSDSIYTESSFSIDKQRQTLKMNRSLQQLYASLSDTLPGNPLSHNLNAFSSRYAADFFYAIDEDVFNELMAYKPATMYANDYATIQRKLMGQLCSHEFKTEFFGGLKSASSIAELYKFTDDELYFAYLPSKTAFVLCDLKKIGDIELVNNKSKKENLISELRDKNDKLMSRAGVIKTQLPKQIKELLTDNYKKIEDINFLEQLSNFDVQANILKTMLNTDII